jgi:hypothetical protein
MSKLIMAVVAEKRWIYSIVVGMVTPPRAFGGGGKSVWRVTLPCDT